MYNCTKSVGFVIVCAKCNENEKAEEESKKSANKND